MNIEDMLRRDAGAAAPREDSAVALELLKPHIAKAAIEAGRRRRHRRERRIFLIAMAAFAVVGALAAVSALQGNFSTVRTLLLAFGALALCALLTLPILERFLPARPRG